MIVYIIMTALSSESSFSFTSRFSIKVSILGKFFDKNNFSRILFVWFKMRLRVNELER